MGSNERYFLSAISVLSFGAFLSLQNACVCSKDLHSEVACHRDRLRIDCGDRSFIAIHEAFFTTQVQNKSTCGLLSIEHEAPLLPSLIAPEQSTSVDCYEDIRVSINKKCSGSGSCLYSYADHADKRCPNRRGEFVVNYDCVQSVSVVDYCNTRLLEPEGYISSPGFPRFYPKVSTCAWTIFPSSGQSILMKVLHVHLRPPNEVIPTAPDLDTLFSTFVLGHWVQEDDSVRCDLDALTILDSGQQVATFCGESTANLRTLELDGGQAEVAFKSTDFVPASGFLIYYKVQGCPSMVSMDGSSYLVEGSNNSMAIFACIHSGTFFNDTQESERVLACIRDHHWNDTLPPCVALEGVSPTSDDRDPEYQAYENRTLPAAAQVKEAAYMEDVIIPSVLMAILIVGNAVIIATIIIIRRRNKAKMAEEDKSFDDPRSEPLVADINDV